MIDIGISKMVIIGVVALIVIGPEKLPGVARTVGTLLGRAQRYVNDVKNEVTQQMELEELNKIKRTVEEAAHEMQNSVNKAKADVYKAQQDIEANIQDKELKAALSQPQDTNVPVVDAKAMTVTSPNMRAQAEQGTLATLLPPTQPVSALQQHAQETMQDLVRKATGKLPVDKLDFQQKCRARRQATPIWYKRRTRARNSLLSSAARHSRISQ